MATNIGLPALTLAFKAAAKTVANRTKRGVAAVIVRDTAALGVHVLRTAAQIPSTLGAANQALIESVFTGSDRGMPSQVIALVISSASGENTALADGLSLLAGHSIDYLAGPADADAGELTAIAAWVKAQRAAYRTVKLVRPVGSSGSDDMGIIDVEETGAYSGDTAVSAGALCFRLAGILAGIPMGESSTYAALPEITAVTERTTAQQNTAISNGKLILIHDGLQAKIARGVNSLVTIPSEGKEDWSKIKIVEGMDLITYFLRTTIENDYMGRYPNLYDNKQLLVAAVSDYFTELEKAGVLSPGESYAQVDYNAQLAWMQAQGVDTSTMTEQQIRTYQTGSYVFLAYGGRLVDAMEDFQGTFTNL